MAENVWEKSGNGGRTKQAIGGCDTPKNHEAIHQEMSTNRPIKSMKLFNEWDVENTSPNCIPRSCCLRIVRLEVFKVFEEDLKGVAICAAMQGSRRSLRSDQIPLPPSGMLDVELDLVFTLQYPHFLKRRENRLQIMLQRRKKYKTRTILGYKTFAVGGINMAQVLQGWWPKQLHLYTKDEKFPAATITIASLSTEPIEREIGPQRHRGSGAAIEPLNSSEEDDESYSSDIEDRDSDGEMVGVEEGYRRQSSRRRKESARNFKQKIIRALFKKLKVVDNELVDVNDLQEELQEECNDDGFMYDDDEDSDPELMDDRISLASVQRPGLRPYFDQNKSQVTLNQNTLTREEATELRGNLYSYNTTDSNEEEVNSQSNGHDSSYKDCEGSPPEDVIDHHLQIGEVERKDFDTLSEGNLEKNALRSLSFREKRPFIEDFQRRRSLDFEKNLKDSNISGFADQLTAVFGTDDSIPEYILMVGLKDEAGKHLAIKLMAKLQTVICTHGNEDVQATIAAVANKFQKFCNRHAVAPPPLRIGVIGPESYLRAVVLSYVEQFSLKSQEYQNFVKFLIIPSGHHKVALYIGQLDAKYQSLFLDTFWKGLFDQGFISDSVLREVEKRILQYVENADSIHSIPIAEALVTFKTHDGESAQEFIPFINEVSLGETAGHYESPIEGETSAAVSSPKEVSIPSERHTSLPTSSPRGDTVDIRTNSAPVASRQEDKDTLDLVVDYWPTHSPSQLAKKEGEKRESNKLQIKSTFCSLCVSRLPTNSDEITGGLLFSANMKNRNKGVKRLMNKKDKDTEHHEAMVGKLVCTGRTTGHTFTTIIDGKEYNNVKFFSLSSQWPTHIKLFPIGMFLNYGYTTP